MTRGVSRTHSTPPQVSSRAAGRAAWWAGLSLAVLYGATVAPGVTFWDAGEFLAAFATFGIPHPPGTPLYIALGRAWTVVAGALGISAPLAGNLLSVVCTAAAGACTAWLVARWTRSTAAGLASALCAGSMATVWSNATETEVYAAALALTLATLVAGEIAGARGESSSGRRATVTTAYLWALAVPLHLSALVGAPTAIWLASRARRGGPERGSAGQTGAAHWRRAGLLGSAAVVAAGAGTARVGVVFAGIVGAIAVAGMPFRPIHATGSGVQPGPRLALAMAGAVAIGLSATLILLIRARHDPWLNQGDPSTWGRFVAVLARRQYAVAPLWPRQAPPWLQLANIAEWADWQIALGRAPGAEPRWQRTPWTLLFLLLGAIGARWHARRDRRSWAAVLILLLSGSVGVVAYLNLKAGPSFGAGVLVDAAPHEARERDYFFSLAWWAWGMWAGLGALAAMRQLARFGSGSVGGAGLRGRGASGLGVLLAALPAALNWRATSRAHPPAAGAAGVYARALLESAPKRAVLFVYGDNDTYPLWQAQGGARVRPDVTVVTTALLPVAWYRAELARRSELLAPGEVAFWRGPAITVRRIAEQAARRGRPIAASLALDSPTRVAVQPGPGEWWLRGPTLVWHPGSATPPGGAPLPKGALWLPLPVGRSVGARYGDFRALQTAALRSGPIPPAWLTDSTGDGVVAWAYRQLACARAALGERPGRPPLPAAPDRRSLESPCQAR